MPASAAVVLKSVNVKVNMNGAINIKKYKKYLTNYAKSDII